MATDNNGDIEVVGLSKGSVLTADDAGVARWLFDNCSSARILISGNGQVWVRGTQGDRDGFLGVMTSQGRFRVDDNQSLVAIDRYCEQMKEPYAALRGSPTLPAGRVTLHAPKMCGGFGGENNPDSIRTPDEPRYPNPWIWHYEAYITADNYHGRVSVVGSPIKGPDSTGEGRRKAKGAHHNVASSGDASLDVLLMANRRGGELSIQGGSNVTRTVLGNVVTAGPSPNVVHANSLRLAAQALDDFRELGELDLKINHAKK
jgi:hypothetical protein